MNIRLDVYLLECMILYLLTHNINMWVQVTEDFPTVDVSVMEYTESGQLQQLLCKDSVIILFTVYSLVTEFSYSFIVFLTAMVCNWQKLAQITSNCLPIKGTLICVLKIQTRKKTQL